jgi:hypothetical protein
MYNGALYSVVLGVSNVGGLERVHEVSKYLQNFFLKCEICQLNDHEYDMNTHTFIITR